MSKDDRKNYLSNCLLIVLEVWLFIDQLIYRYVYQIAQTKYNMIPQTLYHGVSLILFAGVLAFLIAKCYPSVIIMIILAIINFVICIVNIPLIHFIIRKELFLIMIGIMIYKTIEALHNETAA